MVNRRGSLLLYSSGVLPRRLARRGQTSIVALWSIALLFLAVLFSWPVIGPMLNSFHTDDNLVNLVIDLSPFFVIIASIAAYFVYQLVRTGGAAT